MTIERDITATSSVGGDPYFSSVSMLLHGDGTNGAQNNTFLDSSSNNFTITRNGNTTQGSFSPFPLNGQAYSASVNGGSGYFDGVGDYLYTSGAGSFNAASGNWTIEGWMYCLSSTNNDSLIVGNKASNNFYITWIGTTFYLGDGGANTLIIGSAKPINQWFHIAVVKNGSTYTAYLNGSSIGSTTTSLASIALSDWQIGYLGGFSPARYTYGYISSLRVVAGTAVYTSNFTPPTSPLTAITNTSLLLNFTNAGIFDNAAKNDLETVGGAQVSTSVKKYGTGSMYFDGSGDYLSTPDKTQLQLGTGNFTIEFWVYFNSISGYQTIYDKGYNSSGGLLIQTGPGSGRLVVYSGAILIVETGTAATGTWVYYALVRNSSTLTLYRDGVSSGSTTITNNFNNTSSLFLGGSLGGGGYYLNGYIDDLRITKGVARYTANFTPPAQAFPNY